jgi:soluble lytic murein transglycosylase
LKRALRSGDAAFLAQVPDADLGEASRLGPGGAYCLARHFGRLGLEDRATLLYSLEWRSRSGVASELAGRELMAAGSGSGDWEGSLSVATEFLKRRPKDPEALFARLEALVRLGRDSDALRGILPWRDYSRPAAARAYAALASLRLALPQGRDEVIFLIREGRDPAALKALNDVLGSRDPGAPALVDTRELGLLRARCLVIGKEYQAAALAFGPEAFDPDVSAALASDIGKAWLFGGRAEEGARSFAALAEKIPQARAEPRALALLYAGRCLLSLGKQEAALSSLRESYRIAPRGSVKDAALWFLVDGAASLKEAVGLVRSGAASWSDPAYFDDSLVALIGRALSESAYGELALLYRDATPYLSPGMAERLSYLTRRLGLGGAEKRGAGAGDGRLDPGDPGLSGISYYAIMTSVLEARAMSIPPGDAIPSAEAPKAASPEEKFVGSLVEYGLAGEAAAYARSRPEAVGDGFLRGYAAFSKGRGYPADSARLIGVVMGRPGYALRASDLECAYPRPWPAEVEAAAAEFRLPPFLLYALLRTESAFDPAAASSAGAIGLAQLMPETAAGVASRLKAGAPDLLDPATSIRLGAAYLRQLIDYFDGDGMKALLAYNGGMGRVRRWMKENPALETDLLLETVPLGETRDYGRKVLAAQAVYGYLYGGASMRDTVLGLYPDIGRH